MSVFQIGSDKPLPVNVRVTGNTVTTIVDGSNEVYFVPWFQVNEHNGGTHNLTVDLYDATNAYYLGDDNGATWNVKAVTAKASYRFSQGIIVPRTWKLRVTSSDASGYFHVVGMKIKVVT